MRSANYLCVLTGMALLAAGCGHQAAPLTRETFPVAPEALAANGMEVVWHTNATLPEDPVVQKVWLTNQYLVACDKNNRIHAVDAGTGVRMFSAQVAEPFQTVMAPAAYKDTLFVPTTVMLWAFRGVDGRDAGHKKLDFVPTSGAATNGSEVFMADTAGWLQAVVTSTNYVDWNYWTGGRVTAGAVVNNDITQVTRNPEGNPSGNDFDVKGSEVKGWRGVNWGRFTDEPMTARPIVDGSQVYFAGHDGIVYASQQSKRFVMWEHKTEGPCVADLTRTKNNLILAPSTDYTLYAFGAGGRVAWRYHSGEALHKKAFSSGSQVFLPCDEAGLTVLDTVTGKKLWTLVQAADFVSSDPQTVYVLSRSHELMAVTRADGKVKWAMPLPPYALYVPNEADNGLIYLVTTVGKIETIGRKGAAQELPTPGAKITAGPEIKPPPSVAKPVTPPPAAPAAGGDAAAPAPAGDAAAPAAPTEAK
jgi:outer membrane protein assembly factor BamB